MRKIVIWSLKPGVLAINITKPSIMIQTYDVEFHLSYYLVPPKMKPTVVGYLVNESKSLK